MTRSSLLVLLLCLSSYSAAASEFTLDSTKVREAIESSELLMDLGISVPPDQPYNLKIPIAAFVPVLGWITYGINALAGHRFKDVDFIVSYEGEDTLLRCLLWIRKREQLASVYGCTPYGDVSHWPQEIYYDTENGLRLVGGTNVIAEIIK